LSALVDFKNFYIKMHLNPEAEAFVGASQYEYYDPLTGANVDQNGCALRKGIYWKVTDQPQYDFYKDQQIYPCVAEHGQNGWPWPAFSAIAPRVPQQEKTSSPVSSLLNFPPRLVPAVHPIDASSVQAPIIQHGQNEESSLHIPVPLEIVHRLKQRNVYIRVGQNGPTILQVTFGPGPIADVKGINGWVARGEEPTSPILPVGCTSSPVLNRPQQSSVRAHTSADVNWQPGSPFRPLPTPHPSKHFPHRQPQQGCAPRPHLRNNRGRRNQNQNRKHQQMPPLTVEVAPSDLPVAPAVRYQLDAMAAATMEGGGFVRGL